MNLSPKLLDVAHKRLFTKPSTFFHLKCSIRKTPKQGFIFYPSEPCRMAFNPIGKTFSVEKSSD